MPVYVIATDSINKIERNAYSYCRNSRIITVPRPITSNAGKTLDKYPALSYNEKQMEKYPSGSRGSPAKGVVR